MRPQQNSVSAAVLVLVAAATIIVALAVTLPAFLAQGPRGVRTEIVATTVSAAGLVAAIGAAIAAFVTVFQQQIEGRRQRHMETLHLLNSQYERIFDDIYELREAASPSENAILRVHNRFFTTLMTGYRYFELGLIPREDFVEWTATQIGRFHEGRCLVHWDKPSETNQMMARWQQFDSWGRGPRVGFRRYVNAMIEGANGIAAMDSAALQGAFWRAAENVVAAVEAAKPQ